MKEFPSCEQLFKPVALVSGIVQNFSNLFDPVQAVPLGMQVLA